VQSYRYILEGRRSPNKMATYQQLLQSSGGENGTDNTGGGTPGPETTPLHISSTPQVSSRVLLAQISSQQAASPFPSYFSKIIHPLFQKLHVRGITPDDRIAIIAENYSELASCVTGVEDPVGASFFRSAIRSISGYQRSDGSKDKSQPSGRDGLGDGEDGGETVQGNADPQSKFMRNVLASARLRTKGGCRQSVKPLQSKTILSGIISSGSNAFGGFDAGENEDPLFGGKDGLESVPSAGDNLRTLNIDDLMARCKKLIEDMEIMHFGSTVRSNAGDDAREGAPVRENRSVPDSSDIINAALKMSYGADSYYTKHADQTEDFLEMHALPVNSIHSTEDGEQTPPAVSAVPLVTGTGNMGITLQERSISEGLLLPVQVICSCFRHLKYPQSKVVGLILLIRMGLQCTDEVILHRIVPVLILAVEDPFPPVRAMAVRALRSVLQAVGAVNAVEANIFSQYVFPALSLKVARDNEFIVRIAFAESIGRLAETAKRFLEQTHLAAQNRAVADSNATGTATTPLPPDSGLKASTSPTTNADSDVSATSVTVVDFPYDAKLKALHEQINRWIRDLVLDSGSAYDSQQRGYPNSSSNSYVDPRRTSMAVQHAMSAGSAVKRVLLVDVMRLCVFFGQEATMDILLRYILTFLNDSDWELRYAFCAKIASVCAFIGPSVTTEYILPCIENALADVEDRVIVKAIQCLHTLLQMDLLAKFLVVDTVSNIMPLLLNPCPSIHDAAIELTMTAMGKLGAIDSMVFLFPVLQPVCRYDISLCKSIAESEEQFRLALRAQISRKSYRASLVERLERYDTMHSNPNNSSYGSVGSGGTPVPSAGAGSSAVTNRETAKMTSSIMRVPASTTDDLSSSASEYTSSAEAVASHRQQELVSDFGLDPSAMFSSDPDFAPSKPQNATATAAAVTTLEGNHHSTQTNSVASAINAAMTADLPGSSAPSDGENFAVNALGDLEDHEKLLIIKSYLDRVAQEINQKSIQQRNFLMLSSTSGSGHQQQQIRYDNEATNSTGAGAMTMTGSRSRRVTSSMVRAAHFSSADSLLDMSTSSVMPEYSTQSLYIPHQKYGVHMVVPSFSNAISNIDQRYAAISDLLSTAKSSQKLRQAFGIVTSQGDLARAINAGAGGPEQWESQLSSFGLGDASTPASGLGAGTRQSNHRRTLGIRGSDRMTNTSIASNTSNNTTVNNAAMVAALSSDGGSMVNMQGGNVTAVSHAFGNNAGYDARALARRIKALNIPQLPPDFGSLVQPDDKKFK
jgi:hypothetical protein